MIKEIIDFQDKEFQEKLINGSEKDKITIIGKYSHDNSDKFLGYLLDINILKITLIKDNSESILNLEEEKIYKVTGTIDRYYDQYSKKLKLYVRLKVNKIEELENEEEKNKYLEILTRKEELRKEKEQEHLIKREELKKKNLKRKNRNILEKIEDKLRKKEKINLLYIVSKSFDISNKKRDILNDLYLDEKEKRILKYNFGLDLEKESNIIRIKTRTDEDDAKKRVLDMIQLKLNKENFDGLVFIKGGGSDLDYFEDIVFCEKIVKLNIPFITAIGHTNDNDLLLSQLSDANYNTPTRLGIGFLEIYNNIESENIKEELGSVKTKNVIFMFIIVILLGYSIFSTFFMKREVKEKVETTKLEEVSKEKNTKLEENKKEEKSNTTKNTLKENLDSLKDKIIATEKKDSNNNQKNISTKKVENKSKKLVYSEDYLYTVLSWKGYRGERAIQEFQRDNGMKVTGKVDENLLKKLGIKIEYK
ncbi:exodeoxyribonuclease VII large subunit [uncultured Fusobacterium sp.]|uniref:exodeoxyribonuclease VII large subunit n=1 Tax=uncultured Fusobacterium sp. TaxID=159267 RepID=UPI0025D4215A|nr:exodeoxyribonuclease VII large subunit [uncultured Fusobacterium sp.]